MGPRRTPPPEAEPGLLIEDLQEDIPRKDVTQPTNGVFGTPMLATADWTSPGDIWATFWRICSIASLSTESA